MVWRIEIIVVRVSHVIAVIDCILTTVLETRCSYKKNTFLRSKSILNSVLITNTCLDWVEISFQPAGVVAIKHLKGRLATESIPNFNTASLWPNHTTRHSSSSTISLCEMYSYDIGGLKRTNGQKPFNPRSLRKKKIIIKQIDI